MNGPPPPLVVDVIGRGPAVADVALALCRAGISTQAHANGVGATPPPAAGRSDAVVWLTPTSARSQVPAKPIAALADRARVLCLLVPGKIPARTARDMYAAGADAVYCDPEGRPALVRELAGLVGNAETPPAVQRPPEPSLSRAVWLRLQAGAFPMHPDLEIIGAQGRVLLRGPIAAWSEKVALEALVPRIPGVTRVEDCGLRLVAPDRSDAGVAQAVRSALASDAGVEDTTLAVSAIDGSVTLAGAVTETSELRRAEALAQRVEGVTDVQVLATVDEDRRDQYVRLARDVRRLLAARFPRLDVSASAFGAVVVLSGRVPDPEASDRIAETVRANVGGRLVLNQLDANTGA